MTYPVPSWQRKRSRIRWKEDAAGLLIQGLGSGATVVLEDWGYADAAERNGIWPASVDCVCGGGYAGAGGTSGGVGGLPFVQDIYFCCGLGAGSGFALHSATLGAGQLLPNRSYRFFCPFRRFVDTGFQVAGIRVNSNEASVAAEGSFLLTVVATTDASGDVALQIGQFNAEFGLANFDNPVINEFGPIYAELLGEGGSGGDEGGGPTGSGMDAEGYCNIHFAFPMEQAVAFGRPRSDAERILLPATRDGWINQHDEVLSGRNHFIPTDTGLVFDPAVEATGWDDHCGWQRFLAFAMQGGTFEFYPDGSKPNGDASMHLCQLELPAGGPPVRAAVRGRGLSLAFRDVTGERFTGW